MTKEKFREILAGWCQAESSLADDFIEIRSLTDFLTEVLYETYESAGVAAQGEFAARLAKWIGSAGRDKDRRALYLLLGRLVFLGRKQMIAGYHTAFSRNVASWLMEVEQLSFFGADTETRLSRAVEETAFTEITDSFRLGDFLKLNSIAGRDMRFTWEQGLKTIEPDVFEDTFRETVMRSKTGVSRRNLVLFEDFVGSGSQMKKAVAVACNLKCVERVLLCPIVICPHGAKLAETMASHLDKLSFSPVLELPQRGFIEETAVSGEHKHHRLIRQSLLSVHPKVEGTSGSWPQKTSAFGYKETGAVFCKFDNCPDNSVPVLHHKSDLGWLPLFPRTDREA